MTWTGVLDSRRVALGVKVDWAYAPGEVKVLTSSDGANFEEAKCWQSSTRTEVAFEESLMFDTPRNVKAVAITMRSPQSWGYFGINSAALIAEPGPFMLVRCAAAPLSLLGLGRLCITKHCFCKRRHICVWRAVLGCRQCKDLFGALFRRDCSW